MAWLVVCVLLVLGAWTTLVWADSARSARRYLLAVAACVIAVVLIAAVFVGSHVFVSVYRDALVGWCLQ